MSAFAFIFARGGSKGLPRKNVLPLAGKPLINYSIETALQTPQIERVFVSTEDAEIAATAEQAGATVINRPAELAQDNSPEWAAWQHAVEHVERTVGPFEVFVSLPATSPLRGVVDVTASIEQLANTDADICISVTPAARSPYFNMVKPVENNLVELVNKPKNAVTRRQDAPDVYDITTVVYTAHTGFVKSNSGVFEGKVTSVEIPKHRAVDIDDIYDFKMAEVLVNMKETENA